MFDDRNHVSRNVLLSSGRTSWWISRRRIANHCVPLLAGIGGAFLAPPQVHAQTTWQGGSGLWGDPANWTAGVPNSSTNAFIDGGQSGSGTVTLGSSGSINSLVVNAGYTLASPNNLVGLDLYGNATVNGLVDFGQPGFGRQPGSIRVAGTSASTFSGTGSLRLGSVYNASTFPATFGPALSIYFEKGTIDGGANGIVSQGTIVVDSQSGSYIQGPFTNTGTIRVNNSGDLVVLSNGRWHNSGTVAVDNGFLELRGSLRTSDIGNLTVSAASTLFFSGIVSNQASVFALNANSGSWLSTGGTIQGGTVSISGGAQLLLSGDLRFSQGVTLDAGSNGVSWDRSPDGSLSVTESLTLHNTTLNIGSQGRIFFGGTNAHSLLGIGDVNFGDGPNTTGYFDVTGTKTLVIGPGILLHGSTRILLEGAGGMLNQGTITANVNGALSIASRFTNAATLGVPIGSRVDVTSSLPFVQTAGVLAVDGVFVAGTNGVYINAGLLTGSGTISTGVPTMRGSVMVGGTIAPGSGIGALHVSGSVKLSSGAHLVIETAGLNLSDTLVVDGPLDLTAANDFLDLPANPLPGSQFVVATYTGGLLGQFDVVTPGYAASYATPGEIIVTATPEPGAVVLLGAAFAGALATRRRRNSNLKPSLSLAR